MICFSLSQNLTSVSPCENMLGDVLHNLKFDLEHILKWFKVNSLKPNPGKFRFMILETNTDINVNLFLDGNKIENSQDVALLGITTDDKLSIKTHIQIICRKAKYKLHVTTHKRKYLVADKAKTLCNPFISKFGCLIWIRLTLIWMFAGKLLKSDSHLLKKFAFFLH